MFNGLIKTKPTTSVANVLTIFSKLQIKEKNQKAINIEDTFGEAKSYSKQSSGFNFVQCWRPRLIRFTQTLASFLKAFYRNSVVILL